MTEKELAEVEELLCGGDTNTEAEGKAFKAWAEEWVEALRREELEEAER